MGGVPQGYAAHPNFAPGPPMPGVDRNGVPMHGSVPGDYILLIMIITDTDFLFFLLMAKLQVSQLIPN